MLFFLRYPVRLWRCLLVICVTTMSVGSLYAQNVASLLKIIREDSTLVQLYDTLSTPQRDSLQALLRKEVHTSSGIYQGRINLLLAQYYSNKNSDSLVLYYLNQALPIFEKYQAWKPASFAMYRIGTSYTGASNHVRAINQFFALLRFNQKHRQIAYTGAAYHLLSLNFGFLGDSQKEKEYAKKYMAFAEQQNADTDKIWAYEGWALWLTKQKQYRSAYTFYEKAYRIAQRIKPNPSIEIELLKEMGMSLQQMGFYTEALHKLQQAESLAIQRNVNPRWDFYQSGIYQQKSVAHLSLGQPQKALENAYKAVKLIEEFPRQTYILEALQNLLHIQRSTKNYAQALTTYDRLQIIKDSTLTINKAELTKEIETKYELEKMVAEKEAADNNLKINELKLQNTQNQATILWTLLGVLTLLLGLGYWFFRKKQIYNQEIGRKNQELELLNETKDKLFGIIGHDLRTPVVDLINTLTLIENTQLPPDQFPDQTALLKKKATTIQTMLNNLLYWALSQRNLLHPNPRRIPLNDCIEEALDSLHGLIEEKSLQVEWPTKAPVSINADENHVQIILYNVLHNAIKFSPLGDVIKIVTSEEPSYIMLHLTNNGEAFEWEGYVKNPTSIESHRGTTGEKGTGLGLSVCAELMHLNQGTIRAHPNPTGGTTLVVSFPAFDKAH